MAFAYTICGKHDGLMAIATSPAKAVAIAAAYIEQNGDTPRDQDRDSTDMAATIADLRKSKCRRVTIDNIQVGHESRSGYASAEIVKFDVNWCLGRDW